MSTLDKVTENLVSLLQKEGSLSRKQIVDLLSIDNRRCYDIMGVLGAVPKENPLISKITDEDTGLYVYTGKNADRILESVEIEKLSELIRLEHQRIAQLNFRIKRLEEEISYPLVMKPQLLLQQLEEEENSIFLSLNQIHM